MAKMRSVTSNKADKERHALYGSTTTSDTNGDGITEKQHFILSLNSSWILVIINVPNPEPVPPPSEWAN